MRRHGMRAVLLSVVACAGLVASGAAPAAAARRSVSQASASLTLSAKAGPPTSTVMVSGSGFSADEAVDVYFDSTDEALAIAGADGGFAGIPITVPASALPGTHYISAVSRHTGQGAQD